MLTSELKAMGHLFTCCADSSNPTLSVFITGPFFSVSSGKSELNHRRDSEHHGAADAYYSNSRVRCSFMSNGV